MPSEAVTIPSLQQPNWALKAPFEFAENNSVLKKLFQNVGYKEGTAALGKDGQGIKEPIQVGMWPENQGLGFNAADRLLEVLLFCLVFFFKHSSVGFL